MHSNSQTIRDQAIAAGVLRPGKDLSPNPPDVIDLTFLPLDDAARASAELSRRGLIRDADFCGDNAAKRPKPRTRRKLTRRAARALQRRAAS